MKKLYCSFWTLDVWKEKSMLKNRWLKILLFACFGFTMAVFSGCTMLNDYQDSGNLNLSGLTAPVKATFSWPKSSLSIRPDESAAQCTFTLGP